MASYQHSLEQVAKMLGVSLERVKYAAYRATVTGYNPPAGTMVSDKEIARINEKL